MPSTFNQFTNYSIKLAIAVSFFILAACNKKNNAPSGANVIRYKVDGKQVEISGEYSAMTKAGVHYGLVNNNNTIAISGKLSNSYDAIYIYIPTSVNANAAINFNDADANITMTSSSMDSWHGNIGSGQIQISLNAPTVIAGSFNGTLFYKVIGGNNIDSVKITDGYFDIAK